MNRRTNRPIFQEGETVGDPKLEAQFSELQKRNQQLEDQVKELLAGREKDQVTSFVDGLVRDRKLLQKDRDAEIKFILSLPNEKTVNYGEGQDLTQRQAYMNRLSDRKPLWTDKRLPIGPEDAPTDYTDTTEYGEGYDPATIKLDRAIRAKCVAMGKDPSVPEFYEAAWDLLIREGAASKTF